MAANPIISLKTAVSYDIEVYEGDTTGMVLTFTDTSEARAYDLTGAVIIMQIKTAPGGVLQQEFSTTDGDIVISGAGSNIVTIKGWEDLTVGTYVYDLQVTLAGEVRTYLVGAVRVTQDVTE